MQIVRTASRGCKEPRAGQECPASLSHTIQSTFLRAPPQGSHGSSKYAPSTWAQEMARATRFAAHDILWLRLNFDTIYLWDFPTQDDEEQHDGDSNHRQQGPGDDPEEGPR